MTAPSTAQAVIITAALTGPIAGKDDHSSLPVTPEEIAAAAEVSSEAGAAVVHVHLRDDAGRPTADLRVAERVVGLIGESCGALVQLSTGVGLDVPFEERERLVEVRPAMASLNVCSMTFGSGEFRNPPDGVRRLASRMAELGVKPELEIYDTGHIEAALRLYEEGLLEAPLQFSIVAGVRGGMPARPESLVAAVQMLPPGSIWQTVAVGRNHVPLLTLGMALGGNARTGLEDTLLLARGVQAPDNGVLVRRAVEIAKMLGREPLTSSQAADVLQLAAGTAA